MRDLLGLPWPCCFCPRRGLGFGDALGFTFASQNAVGRHGIVCCFRAFYCVCGSRNACVDLTIRGFCSFFFPSNDTGVARRLVFSAIEILLGLVKLPLSFLLSFLAGAGGGWEGEI
jgi:hypothetical protein